MLVQIIKSDFNILWVINGNLLSAPCFMELSDLYWVSDGHPAGTFDLALKNEKLQHTLVCSEDTIESISREIVRQRRACSIILNL